MNESTVRAALSSSGDMLDADEISDVIVEGDTALTCPHRPREIDPFGGSARLAEAGVPVLGRIPFDTRLAVTADRGLPLVLGDPRGPAAFEFARIGAAVRRGRPAA